MSHRPTGPACGNNPNHQLSDGDRQAVEWFQAYLEQRGDGRGEVVRRRKRPVEVHTIQWTGDNEEAVQAFTGGDASNFYALDDADRQNSDDPEATATVYDRLRSTWMLVYTGQHIIRGVQGEFYPIAEDVLSETYERVDDAPTAPELPVDRVALREPIADALSTADGWVWAPGYDRTQSPAYQGYLKQADAVLAVLPPPTDRAAVLREAAEAIAAHPGPIPWLPSLPKGDGEGFWWDTRDRDAAATLLRRMADETATTETHACDNCEGVDPDTCFNNPTRPPEQCPRSEFEDYGQRCQKPAGHNLCSFEEQPAAGARQDGAQP